jgi:hypothetical protein
MSMHVGILSEKEINRRRDIFIVRVYQQAVMNFLEIAGNFMNGCTIASFS